MGSSTDLELGRGDFESGFFAVIYQVKNRNNKINILQNVFSYFYRINQEKEMVIPAISFSWVVIITNQADCPETETPTGSLNAAKLFRRASVTESNSDT